MPSFGLSNNKEWRWCMWMIAAYRWTRSPRLSAWSEGWWPCNSCGCNDSTINADIGVIIITRPSCSTGLVWPVAIDGVVWSVDLSVCHDPRKVVELINLFGMWTQVGQRNHV